MSEKGTLTESEKVISGIIDAVISVLNEPRENLPNGYMPALLEDPSTKNLVEIQGKTPSQIVRQAIAAAIFEKGTKGYTGANYDYDTLQNIYENIKIMDAETLHQEICSQLSIMETLGPCARSTIHR